MTREFFQNFEKQLDAQVAENDPRKILIYLGICVVLFLIGKILVSIGTKKQLGDLPHYQEVIGGLLYIISAILFIFLLIPGVLLKGAGILAFLFIALGLFEIWQTKEKNT
ncbi:MAG: hypothetical protein ABIC19_04355 [Patescibacteria group bacterium]|nr:hypothetical protein [Patescibacteria group bacterium]